MNRPKTYAIVVAGGQGARMGMALPKQFLPLAGKPILYYTLKAFLDAYPDIHIILVLPKEQLSYGNMVLQQFDTIPELQIAIGGATRYESVQNGLEWVAEEDAIVFVHDGVRPFVTPQLIQACYQMAFENGSAIPCVDVVDSMRICDSNTVHEIIDRNRLKIIQTPQTFRAKELISAFAQRYQEHFTDEASVMESAGNTVCLMPGERYNIKITHPEDLMIAEAILATINAAQNERDYALPK